MRSPKKTPLIKLPDVAALLGVPLDTARDMAKAKRLPPPIPIGKGRRRVHLRWRRAQIESLVVGGASS